MISKSNVWIFDTTLRDGEQAPGFTMNMAQKLEVAKMLEKLKIDIIEAGFPVSSKDQFDAVEIVSKTVKDCAVAGLCRAVQKDIDAAALALKKAKRPVIHTFIATSPIHMEKKLKKKPDQVLAQAVEAVKYAKKKVSHVEFSAEDAGRSELDFLVRITEAVIDAGAIVVNIPDTVGYQLPTSYGAMIKHLMENVKNINKARISVHCHNDLGMGTANSLTAVLNGARQIECTVNGIGERAGNAALEEVVMAIKLRKDIFKVKTRVNTKYLVPASKLLTKVTGIKPPPNKAIVGENAFAHESGIHQDGMLKHRTTYEIMTPQSVGWKDTKIVLGRHSGRAGLKAKLKNLGVDIDGEKLNDVYEKFLLLADKKKEVYDEDLMTLADDEMKDFPAVYSIDSVQTTAGNKVIPTATVVLRKGNALMKEAATGDGPIDAVYNAIEKITKVKFKLADYKIDSVTAGKDALGEVTVRVISGKKEILARASSTDIIEASAKAYLNAVNRYLQKVPVLNI